MFTRVNTRALFSPTCSAQCAAQGLLDTLEARLNGYGDGAVGAYFARRRVSSKIGEVALEWYNLVVLFDIQKIMNKL